MRQIINLANVVFGFNHWSSEIIETKLEKVEVVKRRTTEGGTYENENVLYVAACTTTIQVNIALSPTILNNLSVVIPTKDDHLRIKENLDSIIQFLNENIKQFEIIIVSNGSTTDSINSINKQIYNFDSISHKIIQTAGKGLAIRTGIKHSKFSNVLLTDADSSVDIKEFKKFFH